MNKKWLITLGIVAFLLVGVCVLAVFWLSSSTRQRSISSRPLVLIHNPLNRQVVRVDEGVIVHATARAAGGLSKIELWVDGALVDAQANPGEETAQILVLTSSWQATTKGNHSLVVRAISSGGVEGQASLTVDAVDALVRGEPPASAHILQPGETVNAVAESCGISPDELAALNPELGAAEPGPGDVLRCPPEGGSPGPDEPEESEPGGAPPASGPPFAGEEGEVPPDPTGESPTALGGFRLLFFAERFQLPAEPVLLTLEGLGLETVSPYESLHCYLSLGGSDPLWVPDADGDQSTDESFPTTDGIAWEVATHLSGEQAANILWPEDQPLPFRLTCEGIAGGGSDAIHLGGVDVSVSPELWGVIHQTTSTGGEGAFILEYQVSLAGTGRGFPISPDLSMAPPTNVRIDEAQSLLQWDYQPFEGEEPIDGFCIYLNGDLQWSESAESRDSHLPPEWLNPPCGDEYSFTVASFQGNCLPENPQSFPSAPAVLVGDETCESFLVVTFETLTTTDLGGDDRHDAGDVGPVYGSLFANEQQIGFNGRALEGDNFPSELGLNHNASYNVSNITTNFGGGPAQLLVEIPPGDPVVEELVLWVGYEIWDADRGSDSPDDSLCKGEGGYYESTLAGSFEGRIESDLPAGTRGRCTVTFNVEPHGENAVVDPGAPPPLPSLSIVNIRVGVDSGQTFLVVRNEGMAAWANRDLEIAVRSRDGEPLGVFNFPGLSLEPGATVLLSHPDLRPAQPLGICATPDPNNQVEEQRDRLVASGILSAHREYCRPLPDLSISEAEYDSERNILQVRVENSARTSGLSSVTDGSLELINVNLQMNLVSGGSIETILPRVNLDAHDSEVMEWPISAADRPRMRDGYTIVIDPTDAIPELDEDNNQFSVEGSTLLRLAWPCGWVRFCETGRLTVYGENIGGRNTWTMHLVATVFGGGSSRVIADWTAPEVEASWDNTTNNWCGASTGYNTDWFEVAGDETLFVHRWTGLDIVGHGYRWFEGGGDSLSTIDGFGGVTLLPRDTSGECLTQGVCPLTWGGGGGVGCLPSSCTVIDTDAGEHHSGTIYVSGDDINGTCMWNTSYIIYQAEE